MEAQENVALQIAEQMSDYLLRGAISMRSISPRSAPRRRALLAVDWPDTSPKAGSSAQA
jgi:hypothetical protein